MQNSSRYDAAAAADRGDMLYSGTASLRQPALSNRIRQQHVRPSSVQYHRHSADHQRMSDHHPERYRYRHRQPISDVLFSRRGKRRCLYRIGCHGQ